MRSVEEVIKSRPKFQRDLLRDYYGSVVGLQKAIVRDLKMMNLSENFILERIVDRLQLIIKSAGGIGRLIENELYYMELQRMHEENKMLKKQLKAMYKEKKELKQINENMQRKLVELEDMNKGGEEND